MQFVRVTPRVAPALDAAVAAGFSLLALTEIGLRWDDGYSAGPPELNVPLLLLVTLPLVLRRRAPWVALTTAFGAVVLPSLFVGHTLFFFGGLLPLALLVYSAARWTARRSWAVLLAPLALIAAYPLHEPPFGAADYTFVSALFAAAWGIGRLIRRLEDQRARLADALSAQLREQAAHEHALLLDERARIARELHDVVAHAVSVMVVQAGAARFALGTDEDEVRSRLQSIAETGRSAVADLRRVLQVLRAATDACSGPLPGLAQLQVLAEGLGRAGLAVRIDIDRPPAELPPALDVTAFRIVQEALTNTLKHSAATTAHVAITDAPGAVVVEVTDPGPARSRAAGGLSGGQGLVGIGERVALFDGRLDVGPEERGWRVRAELPLTRAVTGADT